MRVVVLAFALALAGCPGSLKADLDTGGSGSGSGSGGGGGAPIECRMASDCAPAGAKCCDCPTHAVPTTDPSYRACMDVDCPTPSCGSPMQADCEAGRCVLECSPVGCDISCGNGFVTDGNGCLICECAGPSAGDCGVDADCTRVRADCCGCSLGGADTAVPATQVPAHEAQLMCPANPSCPGGDTCAPDLAARCVQGSCALVAGALPSNACGRADLAPCAVGEVCVLNANDPATMQSVGVCQPPP